MYNTTPADLRQQAEDCRDYADYCPDRSERYFWLLQADTLEYQAWEQEVAKAAEKKTA